MAIVRFATECDQCGARSAEYTAFPSCEDCANDVCPVCTHHVTVEADLDQHPRVICHRCELDRMREADADDIDLEAK